MMRKTAKNPSGLTVLFNEDSHTYRVLETGQILTSVTMFIGGFFAAFETDKVAKQCVGKPKYGQLTAEQIKGLWEKEAERGRNEGTAVHLYAECLGEGRFDRLPKPASIREEKLFYQALLAVLALEERFVSLGNEIIIFSPELGLAGTIDKLMFDPHKMDLVLLDWKQNKKISTKNPYQYAHPPIETMEDTAFAHYSLQLNLYEKILRTEGYYRFPGFNKIRKALIHLWEDDFNVISIPDMANEIDKMIACGKRCK